MIIENLFANILSMSTIASIVFLMTILVRKFVKNKVSSSRLCLLWIIFICTLIFPLKFSSPLSIRNFINHNKSSVIIDLANSYDFNNSDSTTYNINVKDSNNLEIKINNTINKTTKVEKKDVSNSVLLEDITEKEYEDIINKISNNKAYNKIYEDISNSNIEIGDIA